MYGDSLLSTGTCPAGTLTATFTTSAGAGTFSQGGDAGNLIFTRLAATPSPFSGTWSLTHTVLAVTNAIACAEAAALIGVPQNEGFPVIVSSTGSFQEQTADGISDTVNNAGAVTFTIPAGTGTCGGGGTGTGTANLSSLNNASWTFNTANGVSGIWTLTRQ